MAPTLQLAFVPVRDPARPESRQRVRLTVKTASGAIPDAGTVELFAYALDRRRERSTDRTDQTDLYLSGPDQAEAAPRGGFVHSLGSQTADWQSEAPPLPDADRPAAQPDRLRLRLNFVMQSSVRSSGDAKPRPPRQPRSPPERGGNETSGFTGETAPDGDLFPVLPNPLAEAPLFLPQLPPSRRRLGRDRVHRARRDRRAGSVLPTGPGAEPRRKYRDGDARGHAPAGGSALSLARTRRP